MTDIDTAFFDLITNFIEENKGDHKEISVCLAQVKKQLSDGEVRMTKIEGLCENSKEIRINCFKQQDDMEKRMRKVENITTVLNVKAGLLGLIGGLISGLITGIAVWFKS